MKILKTFFKKVVDTGSIIIMRRAIPPLLCPESGPPFKS
nr:MAG TPA: hypothetical protein [Caudoviricetes sp.]DAG32443.1 MAG TPA: hypothetical protein [Caudoviricetes sp.]